MSTPHTRPSRLLLKRVIILFKIVSILNRRKDKGLLANDAMAIIRITTIGTRVMTIFRILTVGWQNTKT